MALRSQRQGTHAYVITLQGGPDGGVCTLQGTHTPRVGETRFDILMQLRTDAARSHRGLDDAVVLFFSLDRNTL
ncbi:hypothetical protein ACIRQY_31000 [Streptomyces sp. NPDC101490]|uniref:hypothetical protein n=1 Tax=Streptomyces sp. NPDC101490 TaxID=3366143 RepID=UPI003807A9A3